MEPLNLVQTILLYALPVIFAITVHEAAHGYVAHHFGDDTAWMLGRVTLNPLKHIDPIGTVLIPLLLAVSGSPFIFGYAKPVPVNVRNLRNPKRDMMWVALAGPASNFIQAFLWGLLLCAFLVLGVNERFFLQMAGGGIFINLAMWAFNLFPLPPLDGGRVLAGVLPRGRAQELLARIEPFGFFIVMALVVGKVIGVWWMQPLMTAGSYVIRLLLPPLSVLLQ